MAKDEPKPYRDDERAAIERQAELERELESPSVRSSDDATGPGRKEVEAQLAAVWASRFDAEVHRGEIAKVAVRPRWAPLPRKGAGLIKRRDLVVGVALLVVLAIGGAVRWMRGADQRRIDARVAYCGAHPLSCGL